MCKKLMFTWKAHSSLHQCLWAHKGTALTGFLFYLLKSDRTFDRHIFFLTEMFLMRLDNPWILTPLPRCLWPPRLHRQGPRGARQMGGVRPPDHRPIRGGSSAFLHHLHPQGQQHGGLQEGRLSLEPWPLTCRPLYIVIAQCHIFPTEYKKERWRLTTIDLQIIIHSNLGSNVICRSASLQSPTAISNAHNGYD